HAISIPKSTESDENLLVFHAGTRRDPDGQLVTGGGRVLGVVGLGASVTEAAQKSKEAAESVQFDGKYFRGDIGFREIQREHE
ncbi:MAG: phosphoribosylglycinamide synthetase C domain-containing protein, partial [Myxococcota bacterium]